MYQCRADQNCADINDSTCDRKYVPNCQEWEPRRRRPERHAAGMEGGVYEDNIDKARSVWNFNLLFQ
jgi:hypothetical protein